MTRHILLTENTRFGGETGAGLMRNRCAFTPKDMGYEFDSAFTYAIVFGWEDALSEQADKWGWDEELVAFIRNAHEQFAALSDRREDDDA